MTVRDENGVTVGKDFLSYGTATAMDGDTVTTCVFTFSVDVPRDVESYHVTVGTATPTSFRPSEVERDGWEVWIEGST